MEETPPLSEVVQVLGAELSAAKWGELKSDVQDVIRRLKK